MDTLHISLVPRLLSSHHLPALPVQDLSLQPTFDTTAHHRISIMSGHIFEAGYDLDSDTSHGPREPLENGYHEQPSDANRAAIDVRWGPPSSTHESSRACPAIINPLLGARYETSIRRGTGRIFPTEFCPPSATSTPDALFPVGVGNRAIPPVVRFIRRDDPEQVLFYADGACRNNGHADPKAGWAFVLNPNRSISGCLEQRGPFGDPGAQTNNRAELRDVLAALRLRHWVGEGLKTIVFATDSEYVAEGATMWARNWVRNGWRTNSGAEVKNKDLWEMLLGEAERWNDMGLRIQFWRIPRELNSVADQAAKQASEQDENLSEYCEIAGVFM